MTKTNLPLDADRLWTDVMALADITDPARPYTRRSFTALFLEGRAWLAERFAEAGLTTHIDTAGNLIGRLEGLNPALGAVAGLFFLDETLTLIQWAAIASIVAASAGSAATRELARN